MPTFRRAAPVGAGRSGRPSASPSRIPDPAPASAPGISSSESWPTRPSSPCRADCCWSARGRAAGARARHRLRGLRRGAPAVRDRPPRLPFDVPIDAVGVARRRSGAGTDDETGDRARRPRRHAPALARLARRRRPRSRRRRPARTTAPAAAAELDARGGAGNWRTLLERFAGPRAGLPPARRGGQRSLRRLQARESACGLHGRAGGARAGGARAARGSSARRRRDGRERSSGSAATLTSSAAATS
jgi:hypothetical protein